jgi:Ribosomal protein L33
MKKMEAKKFCTNCQSHKIFSEGKYIISKSKAKVTVWKCRDCLTKINRLITEDHRKI